MSLVTRKYIALFCAVGASAYLAACGDSNSAPDARIPNEFDANVPVPDAGPPDATPAFAGSIAVNEIAVQGHPEFGQGLQIAASFTSDAVKPALVEGNIAKGCTVLVLTKDQAAAPGLDEGDITITAADNTPVIPKCSFQAGNVGYKCIGKTGAGTVSVIDDADPLAGGKLPPQSAAVTFVTNPATTFSATDVTGNYVKIQGPAGPNVGTFPILALAPDPFPPGTVIIGNPKAVSTGASPITGGFAVVAGVGPIPGAPADGFLADDDNVSIKLTPKAPFPTPVDINFGTAGAGDHFALDTASGTLLNAIPTDGKGFTLTVDPANAGTAAGQVLVINTTDTAADPDSFVDFPDPTAKKVTITCTALGGTSITVSDAVADFIKTSGAKKIQALFFRVNFVPVGTPNKNAINSISGHGFVGFTVPK